MGLHQIPKRNERAVALMSNLRMDGDAGGMSRDPSSSPEVTHKAGDALSSSTGSDASSHAPSEHWVPLRVPRQRRLQTGAVILWSVLPLLMLASFFWMLSFPPTWPLLIVYLVWVYGFDDAPMNGGRPWLAFRQSQIWRNFAGYFPVSLIKTETLPADRKYIFGYHPHGIIGMGAICSFGSDATNFSKLYPGITPHLLTLASNFKMPFFRDALMALGMGSVSSRSCANILRKGPGSSITIVVGGAAESLSARPGTADLTLKRRLGFIRLAVKEGADLVPVFSFGENDIFEQMSNRKGTRLYVLQKRFQAIFGWTLPIFHGRGIFNYSFGLMPYRHPIVSVVGRPIRVQQNDKPSIDELQEVQERYITELMHVWDTYKDVYAAGRKRELSIIE